MIVGGFTDDFSMTLGWFSDAFIDLTVSGGQAPYSYLWSNGFITEDISNISAGLYSVIVTDINNCIAYDTIVITEPQGMQINLAVSNVLCYGGNTGIASINASGGALPYVYDWGNSDPNALTAGSYNVLVTDDNNCYVNSQFTITEPDSLYISNISVTDIICYGETGSVSIFGNGGIPSYNEVILGGQDPNNLMSGNYDAIIIDQNGCVSDPVTFIVNQPLELQINYSNSILLPYEKGQEYWNEHF